jgi:hypothetical protein
MLGKGRSSQKEDFSMQWHCAKASRYERRYRHKKAGLMTEPRESLNVN